MRINSNNDNITGVDSIGKIVTDAASRIPTRNGRASKAGLSKINVPSFDEGGTVEGEEGEPKLILAHGQEEVLKPSDAETYRENTMKPIGTQSKPTGIGRIEGMSERGPHTSTSDSPETQLIARDMSEKGTPEERAAIDVDKKKAMGQGVNGLVALGTAKLHENHLDAEPAPADVTMPAPDATAAPRTPGLKPILTPEQLGTSTADATAKPEAIPTGRMQFKNQIANYDARIQAALDKATPQGQEEADRLSEAKQEFMHSQPWGSAVSAHPGLMGKIGHVLGKVGNIGLDVVAPGTAALIPGTEMARNLQHANTLGRINLDTESTLRGAEAAEKNAQAKALDNPPEKAGEYEFKTDDDGQMWRLDKLSKAPPMLVTFGAQGQPTLSPAPEGSKPPAVTSGAVAQPTFGKKTAKGKEAPANDVQMGEFTSQLPVIAPALAAGERETFAFPKGYTPTLAEIDENKKAAHAANEAKLAGKREDLATQTANAALNKRTQEEKLIEQVAKNIAPMDVSSLSRLKDITSMRSDQRSLIYARAKELNPEFNTAEVDRKVKMLDNFTNGKDGQQLQSFGTFLEHAGDANQVIQSIRNSVTPQILNVGINALEKHGWGTTATQLSAALEPVRKEFEGFLLGGRALYADDRKAAETILSDASTPAQVQTALKQMAHTVSARYNEMNNRFKTTMKTDISKGIGPLSDAAYNSAEAIGVTKLGGKELRDGKHGYGWYNSEEK
jgi:hypothetical protein